MALLNNCSANYYQTLPACLVSFTVGGLQPNTPYHYFIEDKFQHIYHEEVMTDEKGVLEVFAEDFPDAFFNPYAGQMVMELKAGLGYCEPVVLTYCGEEYDRIILDFKNGKFSTHIPCTC